MKWAECHSLTRSCSASRSRTRTRHATNAQRLRWLQRFIDERLPPLAEVALAASALAELRHGRRNTGVEMLKAVGSARLEEGVCGCRRTLLMPQIPSVVQKALSDQVFPEPLFPAT